MNKTILPLIFCLLVLPTVAFVYSDWNFPTLRQQGEEIDHEQERLDDQRQERRRELQEDEDQRELKRLIRRCSQNPDSRECR